MRRYLCPKHAHHLKDKTRPIKLSHESCTACRWEKRPWTLGDFAAELEGIAQNLRFAQEHEHYDPHGVTFAGDIEDFMVNWIKTINPSYGKSLLERINEKCRFK